MNVFLIGYRCTGKSTIGRALARRLDWPFLDTDDELVRIEGKTIAEMVSENGWAFFREKEKNVVRTLSALDRHVIATGGGVVLDHENIRQMRRNGRIIWLKASPETIERRMRQDQNTQDLRPALTNRQIDQEVRETLAERRPLYEEAGDIRIDTDESGIDQLCQTILAHLKA